MPYLGISCLESWQLFLIMLIILSKVYCISNDTLIGTRIKCKNMKKLIFWSLQKDVLKYYRMISICYNNSNSLCTTLTPLFQCKQHSGGFADDLIMSSRTTVYSVSTTDGMPIQCTGMKQEVCIKHLFYIMGCCGCLEEKHVCN